MNKIEHCPFCGASQTFFSFVLMLQFWKAGFYVECFRCGARGPAKVTKIRAAGAWNYRHVAHKGGAKTAQPVVQGDTLPFTPVK